MYWKLGEADKVKISYFQATWKVYFWCAALLQPNMKKLEQKTFKKDDIVVINLSGRGDKDLQTYIDYFKY